MVCFADVYFTPDDAANYIMDDYAYDAADFETEEGGPYHGVKW